MPTYNRGDLIGESIQSIVNQTYQHWELIIVDDGSTDNTPQTVTRFSDPRIFYSSFPHSGSFGAARNRGIASARGEMIAFLDSDDLWEPDKLTKQLEVLNIQHESYFVFNNVLLFGDNRVQSPSLTDLFDVNLFLNIWNEDGIVFYPSSLLFRKNVIARVGLLDEQRKHGADLDYLFALSESFKGNFLGERLVRIRKHAHNTSATDIVFGYDDSIAHAKKYYHRGSLSRKIYRRLLGKYYYKKGMVYLAHHKKSQARSCFLSCCRYKPFYVKAWVRVIQSIF
jgi:glycosyltransferase involved in cell wall biosynthesis